MTHILSTRRRLTTPPELPESTRAGAPRSSTGPAWLLGRALRPAVTPIDLALARARSEIAVDTLLDTLPEHWAAFSSPALGGDNACAVRLLVGPGGVLALHAQLYDGRIAWVHGHTVFAAGACSPNLALAAADAHRLTALLRGRLPLRTAVQPALVVLGARALWTSGRPTARKAGMPVLGAGALGSWLAARPQVLRPIERMELAAVIDNPLTWGVRPSIVPRPDTVGE
ncbi:hypothetical protein E3O25_06050 [Cryobacterium sp. TMT1-3]|uniref:NERD domain-containing protein n=1 Tax=Cryobacterium luteum TaxID=1424661 RepID=A0A1H8J4V4_9MICO|nr:MULTISPECIES: hypothetical protein [Cryobacterium]TFB93322.1 hypothetical protein E3O10_03350 [Cryobacterium luteum]TFC28763.1 hypothetical protein E3O25_06050 [Cryobacterium sp. TMT1-3]SEN75844.1 hypothetical protein SAMN05216281_11378 [Cryobacterium luteum]